MNSYSGLSDTGVEAFAAIEPYFTVFPAPQFLRANLTEATEREFFQNGETRIDVIFKTIELRLAPHFAPTAVLEYGCGPGRLALPLARRAARRGGTVTAVDRSPAMLEHAQRNAARFGLSNIRLVTPTQLFAESQTFDFVNCYLLLQRLRPAEGMPLMRALLQRLAPGGIAAFQFLYRTRVPLPIQASRWVRERLPALNRPINRLRGRQSDEPFFPTHVYDVDAVLETFHQEGFHATHVVFDDHDDLWGAIVLAEAPLSQLPSISPAADEPERPIDVRELTATRSIEDLNAAAERYFSSVSDWEFHLAKPFSSADETPSLLMDTAVVLQALRVMPGATVLEFGAGTGWLARFLTQLGCRVVLLDVSPTALLMARELYRRQPPIGDRPAADFLRFDGARIALPDASVDRIVSFHAFHHVPNPDAVLRELARVLKPGGIAAFAEPGPRHSFTEQSQFEMRMFGVVENDIDVHHVWRTAQACGFADLKMIVSHGPPFHVSLAQFEDLLAGGEAAAAWSGSTRTYLRNVRNFFLVREGIERVDSRHAHGLRCELHVLPAREQPAAGLPIAFDVSVTNTGAAVWLPSDEPYGGVAIGVHVHNLVTSMVTTTVLPERLVDPPREIAPAETCRLRLLLPPQAAGKYLVEFDCVSSRVAWFAQMGSHPATVSIDVI